MPLCYWDPALELHCTGLFFINKIIIKIERNDQTNIPIAWPQTDHWSFDSTRQCWRERQF